MTGVTIKQLYDEIIKNRSEIKNSIEASETRLLLEIAEHRKRLNDLEEENSKLKEEVEELKSISKKNNIIIFGIKHQAKEANTTFLKKQLKDLLDINLEVTDINDSYTLGSAEDSPIKIELTTYVKKREILQNCHKLKGKNISISHDLTPKERVRKKQLRKHLYLAQKDKNNTCYIKKNKLYVNGEGYTLEDLEESEDAGEDSKPTSAPTTPSVSINASLPSLILHQAKAEENPNTPQKGASRGNKTYATRQRVLK